MEVPPNGWLKIENLIEVDDFGVPLFQEALICSVDIWNLLWLVVEPTPLKNDGVRQIESSSQLLGKILSRKLT